MIYALTTKVLKIERKRKAVRSRRTGTGPQDWEIEYEDLGYYVQLEGMAESISLGTEEPKLKVGQGVKLFVEGVEE